MSAPSSEAEVSPLVSRGESATRRDMLVTAPLAAPREAHERLGRVGHVAEVQRRGRHDDVRVGRDLGLAEELDERGHGIARPVAFPVAADERAAGHGVLLIARQLKNDAGVCVAQLDESHV